MAVSEHNEVLAEALSAWAVNTKVTCLVSGEGGPLSEELLQIAGALVSFSKSLQIGRRVFM